MQFTEKYNSKEIDISQLIRNVILLSYEEKDFSGKFSLRRFRFTIP